MARTSTARRAFSIAALTAALFLFAPLLCRAAPVERLQGISPATPSPPVEGARTLTRTEDPVILHGNDLPGMLGRPVTGLRAYAFREGTLSPIPFQVDEFDKKGRIVSAEGEHPGKDEDDGKLDGNDEVVVMASDLGDPASPDLYPRAARACSAVEVSDPETGGRGWFTVCDFDAPPEPSAISYVHYDPKEDVVETPLYVIDFNKQNPILLDNLRIRNRVGDPGVNLIDRIKVRAVLKTRLYLTVHLNEEGVTSRVPAYKNGPIRAVRVIEFYIKLWFLKVTPSGYVDYLFYRNAVVGPSEIKVPFSPKIVLRGGSKSVGGLDFDSNVYGWKFYGQSNRLPITITGETGGGSGLEKKGVSWFGLYGPDRGTMMRIVYGESLLKARVDYTLYYLDDRNREDKPEREKGETLLGFSTDVLQIPRGTHRMWFYQYFAAPWRIGDEKKFNDILDRPLVVKAHAVSLPQPAARAPGAPTPADSAGAAAPR